MPSCSSSYRPAQVRFEHFVIFRTAFLIVHGTHFEFNVARSDESDISHHEHSRSYSTLLLSPRVVPLIFGWCWENVAFVLMLGITGVYDEYNAVPLQLIPPSGIPSLASHHHQRDWDWSQSICTVSIRFDFVPIDWSHIRGWIEFFFVYTTSHPSSSVTLSGVTQKKMTDMGAVWSVYYVNVHARTVPSNWRPQPSVGGPGIPHFQSKKKKGKLRKLLSSFFFLLSAWPLDPPCKQF